MNTDSVPESRGMLSFLSVEESETGESVADNLPI